MSQSVVCRVHGLTSAKGQKLNGLAASFDPLKPPKAEGRLAVTIDGVKGPPLAIKPQNLQMLLMNNPHENLAVAVGRPHLRSEQFMATVVDQRRGRRATAQMLAGSGGAAMRSEGTLKALVEYFQTQKVSKRGDIAVHVIDLNLALLFNSYAYSKAETTLHTNQEGFAQKIRKQILRHTNKDRVILFKYEPFRVGRGDRDPKEMLAAVLASNFHIYPCPCETYLDALEVRYLAPGRSTHCFFLDYGQDETVQYVRNIVSMEEDLERLNPEMLADVDPQMFWSSVLHSRALVKELKKLESCPEELYEQWKNIYSSYLKSVMAFRENCMSPSEAVRLLPGSKGRWNLINEKIHYKVATRNAKLAILVLMSEPLESGEMKNYQRIELMDNYKGSEIDIVVAEFTKACASKDPHDLEIALGSILMWKETKTCDHCGKKQKEMFDCTECYGAMYCGKDCQRAAWPAHKKVCKDLKKSKEETPAEPSMKPKAGLYDAKIFEKHQNNGDVGMYCEACGVGFLRVLWWPANTTMRNFVTFKAMKNDTIFKTETHGLQGGITGQGGMTGQNWSTMMVDADKCLPFSNDFSDIDPITRLCLACGPIPNLELARQTLDDALKQVQGSVFNLKMSWIGFTPLEWAAKKGHMEIVQWLVCEPKTRPLLQVGTPVGWACYTGRVEIARFLVGEGASPDATHEEFWDHRPPLLAAAENGQIEAVKFLVEECGISISTQWRGNDIVKHIHMAPCWYELKGHKKVLKYAQERLLH